MTAPGGTPGLPTGTVLTLDNLESRTQDMTPGAMKVRALEWFPDLANNTTGGNPASLLSPFGFLTDIWSRLNSTIANADPAAVNNVDDLGPLFLDFVEGLPFIGQFVTLVEAFLGQYDGEDPTLLAIQNIFGTIPKLVGGLLSGSWIPQLDASKIGSGTFLTSLIPGLDVSKIVSGIFGGSFIPGLDASKITSGTFGQNMITGLPTALANAGGAFADAIVQALSGGSATGSTAAQVKSALQAIPGGNLIGSIAASLIPGLDASKIVSGALGLSNIPALPADKITSGTFLAGLIPQLSASIISSGQFLAGQIPGLDASKITSGTFGSGLIPGLDASKIITGQLPASFISGTFSAAQTGVDTVWNIIGGAFGQSSSGQTQATAQANLSVLNGRVTVLEGGGVLTKYTTNGTWTKPTVGADGVAFAAEDLFKVGVFNGGAGGGKGSNSIPTSKFPAFGGNSGGYVEKYLRYADLPASVAMTIGAAGAGSTSAGANGSAGGTTSFGSLVVGSPGRGSANAKAPGRGGNGSLYNGTDTNYVSPERGESGPLAPGGEAANNAAGHAGSSAPADSDTGGGGGAGGGHTSATGATSGGVGGYPGGGGGASGFNPSSQPNGAAGAAGQICVTTPH